MPAAAPNVSPKEASAAVYPRAVWIATGVSLLLGAIVLYRLVSALRLAWDARYAFTFDDAYAFCRYADHLLAGWGLAWNPGGPQTFGCTSLLYVFWIALVRTCTRFAPWQALAIGSFVPALLAVIVMGLACARAAATSLLRRPLVGCGFVCLVAGLQNGFFFHVQTGMDTTTAILTNALLVLAVVHPRFSQSAGRLIVTACLAYLTYLARPDNLLYALLFPGLTLGRRWRALGVFAAVLGGLLLADAGIKTLVFGNPLPLPFYAKGGDFYTGYIGAARWNAVRATQEFLIYQGPALALLVLTVTRRSWPLVLATAVPCLLTFGYLGTVIQIMGFDARFYYPTLPFILVAAYHALDRRLAEFRESGRGLLVRLGALAALGLFVFPVANKAAAWYEADCNRRHPNLRPTAVYTSDPPPPLGWVRSIHAITDLMRQCPPTAVWAMSEHGFVGAMSPNVTIIDLAGLHDRNTLTREPIVPHALAQKPDVIWFPHSDYTGLVAALEASPVLADEYDYWPGAFDYGLALRKQSRWQPDIDRATQAVWRQYYQAERPAPARRANR
jgi:hypothetical protein